MTISVFFVITLFVSLGNTDKSGFEIIYKDNKLPELCCLLCEEYIVGFVILTVDINVSASLVYKEQCIILFTERIMESC